MKEGREIPNQPDFSAADPAEAFQLKAVRKFALTEVGREMLERAHERYDFFDVIERVDRARAIRRTRVEFYDYDPKFSGSRHPNFD